MRKIILTTCYLFLAILLDAQTTFQKTFGGSSDDVGNCIQQTTDGGFIIVGTTSSFGSGLKDVYLIKTNAIGDTIWTKMYGEPGSANEVGLFVQQTMDGGYIISGYTDISDPTGAAYLIKTDAIGNVTWAKKFASSGGGNSEGKCIRQTVDGGYIITGYTHESLFPADIGVFLLKIDGSGNLLWKKTVLDGSANEEGLSVNLTSDHGFVVTGYTKSYGAGGSDVYLLKTDSVGTVIWVKTYGGTNDETGNFVQQTKDGGFILVGNSLSFDPASCVYLIKTDSIGNVIWTKTYGYLSTGFPVDVFGSSVQQTIDKGYIISGSIDTFGTGNYDAYLLKTDSIGLMTWAQSFTGTGGGNGYSVEQTTDTSYIMLGSTGSTTNDIYLIKTDKNGVGGCVPMPVGLISNPQVTTVTSITSVATTHPGIPASASPITGNGGTITTICFSNGIKELTSEIKFNIYPNPATNQISIEFDLIEKTNASIEIKNVLGQTIKTISNKGFSKGTNKIEIDVSEFPNGIYFMGMKNDKESISKKFIKG